MESTVTTLISTSSPVMAAVVGIIGTAVLGIIAAGIHLGTRVSVLEVLRQEHVKTLDGLELAKDDVTARIGSVEAVVPELRHLIETLKDVPVILGKLDTLAQDSSRRLARLEDRLDKKA